MGQQDPLEKEMATNSRILPWKIPWTEEPGKLQSTGSQRVGHNLATKQLQTMPFAAIQMDLKIITGFPGDAPICQHRRHRRPGFNPWIRKIPWRRKWQPTPALLPGKSYGQRNLAGYRLEGLKRVRHNLVTKQQQQL